VNVQRKVIPFPGTTLREGQEYYIPTICPTCKFELKEGAHGFTYGGFIPGKGTVLINCPTCTVEAHKQQARIQQIEMINRLFNGAHLPFGTRTWCFDTYPRDADPHAFNVVRQFVERWRVGDEEGKRGLYLGGETGRCKTSLAISALKEVMEAGGIGLLVSVPDLLKKIQATFNRDSEVSENDLLEAVYTVPWLVLDDLGVEKPSDFAVKEFYLIVEKRRMAGLWTLITSNLSTKDLAEYWRPKDVKQGGFHAGVRVVERIREFCLGVEMQGRNQRGIGGK
jgi:DNA replication protein DnaC